jgi:hypothetical protein
MRLTPRRWAATKAECVPFMVGSGWLEALRNGKCGTRALPRVFRILLTSDDPEGIARRGAGCQARVPPRTSSMGAHSRQAACLSPQTLQWQEQDVFLHLLRRVPEPSRRGQHAFGRHAFLIENHDDALPKLIIPGGRRRGGQSFQADSRVSTLLPWQPKQFSRKIVGPSHFPIL